jgi:hypothetical protein
MILGPRSIRYLLWNWINREWRTNRRSDATDEFLELKYDECERDVGQAVAQDLATAACTVTIVVNGVDSSGYLDHAPRA